MSHDPWSPPQSSGGDHASFVSGSAIPDARWGIPDAVVTLVLTLVIALATSLALRPLQPLTPWLVVGATVIPWFGLFGVPWLVARRKGHGWLRDFDVNFTRRTFWLGVGAGFLAVGSAAVIAVTQMVLTGQELTSAAGEVARALAKEPAALVLFALVAAIGAPLVEEIAFRGLLYGALLKRGIPEWGVVVITAAAFALYHFEPQRVLVLFATGLVLGEVRRRSGGTAAPIVAHCINNTIAAIGLLSFL